MSKPIRHELSTAFIATRAFDTKSYQLLKSRVLDSNKFSTIWNLNSWREIDISFFDCNRCRQLSWRILINVSRCLASWRIPINFSRYIASWRILINFSGYLVLVIYLMLSKLLVCFPQINFIKIDILFYIYFLYLYIECESQLRWQLAR